MVWKFCGKAFCGIYFETMQKMCLSTKFPHQEIKWNYGILCSVSNKNINNNITSLTNALICHTSKLASIINSCDVTEKLFYIQNKLLSLCMRHSCFLNYNWFWYFIVRSFYQAGIYCSKSIVEAVEQCVKSF